MTVYIDKDCKVYVSPAEGRTEHEDSFFDNKCTNLVESYRYVPAGETWTREDGEEFVGRMIAPWRDIRQYDGEQQQYLLEQLTAARAESADMQAALAVLGVTNETEETA
nr:MAG TPA: hypothetical protein [Caudoviricetes sp.]